jgi:universal stress protein E
MNGHYRNILCVLSDTHHQDNVVKQAVHIAKSHQASLTLMLALESLPPNASIVMASFSALDSQQSMEAQANDWLVKHADKWSQKYPVKTQVCIGNPLIDIVRYVQKDGCDLVIKKAEDSFLDRLFGSLDMRLLRKCPCPVWVLDPKHEGKYKNVVAAVDLNYHYPEHEIALRKKLNVDILYHASKIALLEFSQLHIVHIFDSVPENIRRDGFISVDDNHMETDLAKIHAEREQALEVLLGELEAKLAPDVMDYLKPKVHIVHGYPRREIAATTQSLATDVIVMGTLARLGVPGYIMGGTAEETIQQLNCAVVGLKPEGFVSPITLEDES